MSLTSFLFKFLCSYACLELGFYLIFHHVLIPKTNLRREPEEYRSCGRARHELMVRIMRRIERTCRATGIPFRLALSTFLKAWFPQDPCRAYTRKDEYKTTSKTTESTSITTEEEEEQQQQRHDAALSLPSQNDMDQFFSWAFFSKDYSEMEPWMKDELSKMYHHFQKSHGIQFDSSSSQKKKKMKNDMEKLGAPMRLSIDPLQPNYRPFGMYVGFAIIKMLGCMIMWMVGFRRYKITDDKSGGLVYWHRGPRHHQKQQYFNPIRTSSSISNGSTTTTTMDDKPLPLLFFHGICPGGFTLYLPMLLWGLAIDGRPVLVFENPSISLRIGFRALTETQTVNGVRKAIDTHLGQGTSVSLVSHSFGTCQASWVINASSLAPRIRQITLIDPVSILLSEPDVISNFVYSRDILRGEKAIVANELFTEYYLRRHFSWYNSELWLEDIPNETKVLVCLAERDEILNYNKIKREVEIYRDDIGGSMKGGMEATSKVDLITWEGRGKSHGYCVTTPSAWKQILFALKNQEQIILQEEACIKQS